MVIDGVMDLTTGGRKVEALEPETGKEIWAYDVTDGAPATRGLEFWTGDRQSPASVFFGKSNVNTDRVATRIQASRFSVSRRNEGTG